MYEIFLATLSRVAENRILKQKQKEKPLKKSVLQE